MNSLQDLNAYSDTKIPYTDLRTAKVSFDRQTAENKSTSFAEGQSHVIPIGINILDIVLPSVEQVSFLIDVSTTTGATVTFLDLPHGYTVDNYGPGYYRINNIQSADDWNRIKYAQVNVSSGQDANFTYTCTITYESIQTKAWTVTALVTQMAALTSAFTISCTGQFTEKQGFGNFYSTTTLSCAAEVRKIISLFSTVSLSLTPTKIPGYVAGIVNTTYIANKGNAIFATNTPRITDDDPLAATYHVTFTSPQGRFGTSTSSSSSLGFTGTIDQVNAWFSSIYFWPNAGYQGNTTYTYVQQKNSSTQITKTVNLTYAGTNTTANTYTFTSSGTWSPTFEESTYCKLDVLVVGGGGGATMGLYAGAGGGGGAVGEVTNLTISSSVYYATVGTGGAANNTVWDQYTYGYTFDAIAGSGTSSIFRSSDNTTLVITALGGTGSRFKISNSTTSDTTNNYNQAGNAGASWSKKINGTTTTYTTTQTTHRSPAWQLVSATWAYGGNGQGSSASAAPIVAPNQFGINTDWGGNGGNGVLSSITGQYYGGGGGGAYNSLLDNLSGQGGLGGGGAGGSNSSYYEEARGGNGSPNTGGGGGGAGSAITTNPPGDGGSGVIIIKTHP